MLDEPTEGSPLPNGRHSEGDASPDLESEPPKTPSSSSSSLSNKNKKEKSAPHYLRPSEGSCHDLCKYGKKQVRENQGKISPLPKSRNGSAKSEKSKLKLNAKHGTPDALKPRESSSTEEIDPKSEKSTPQNGHLIVEYESDGLDLCSSKKLSTSPKTKTTPKIPIHNRASQSRSASRVSDGGSPPSMKKPSPSPEPRILLKRPSLKNRVVHPYLRRASSSSSSSMKIKICKDDGSSSGLAIDQKSSSDDKKKSKISVQSDGHRSASSVRGNSKNKEGSSSGQPIDRKSSEGENKKSNIRPSSVLPNSTRKEGEPSFERRMKKKSTKDEETKSNLLMAAPSLKAKAGKEDGSSSRDPMDRKSTTDVKKRSNMRPVSALVKSSPAENPRASAKEKAFSAVGSRIGQKKALTKTGPKVNTEVRPPSTCRLTFRSGKVVDSSEAYVDPPRRLTFKQVKGIGSSVSESGKRSFKRKEVSRGQSSRQRETLKVALRHREVKDKKESQILLNDVIELTANKLAETSKSKVKALVGAFETVISLQEGKSSAAPS